MYARETKRIKRKRREDRERRNMTEAEKSSQGVSELSITAEKPISCSEVGWRVRSEMEMRSNCFLRQTNNL